jgi:hypothetical protein
MCMHVHLLDIIGARCAGYFEGDGCPLVSLSMFASILMKVAMSEDCTLCVFHHAIPMHEQLSMRFCFVHSSGVSVQGVIQKNSDDCVVRIVFCINYCFLTAPKSCLFVCVHVNTRRTSPSLYNEHFSSRTHFTMMASTTEP